MINLLVDEAYSLDYLSILEVKAAKDKTLIPLHIDCQKYLEAQIGKQLLAQILESQQYSNLVCINARIFASVDLARTNSCTSREVWEQNSRRHKYKQEIQETFFKSGLTEKKL